MNLHVQTGTRLIALGAGRGLAHTIARMASLPESNGLTVVDAVRPKLDAIAAVAQHFDVPVRCVQLRAADIAQVLGPKSVLLVMLDDLEQVLNIVEELPDVPTIIQTVVAWPHAQLYLLRFILVSGPRRRSAIRILKSLGGVSARSPGDSLFKDVRHPQFAAVEPALRNQAFDQNHRDVARMSAGISTEHSATVQLLDGFSPPTSTLFVDASAGWHTPRGLVAAARLALEPGDRWVAHEPIAVWEDSGTGQVRLHRRIVPNPTRALPTPFMRDDGLNAALATERAFRGALATTALTISEMFAVRTSD